MKKIARTDLLFMGSLNKLTLLKKHSYEDKKILTGVVIAVIASAGSYLGLTLSNPEKGLSDIQLANIEALSRKEIVGDKIPCHSDSKRNAKKAFVDCADCIRIEGWEGTGTEATCTR